MELWHKSLERGIRMNQTDRQINGMDVCDELVVWISGMDQFYEPVVWISGMNQ